MTYCVAIKLDAGLVLLSDTRTNAGLDNISRYGKMHSWEVPDERAVVLMTAGNLSITQGVITRLEKRIEMAAIDPECETILNADSLFRVAQMVGETMRDVQERHREGMEAQGASFDATVLVAGQRKGGSTRLFLVYSAGNFIEATRDTPFFQIGEHKYGKPILDRVITPDTPLEKAKLAACVSMDSTLRSNLSVGMPLDLAIIETDALKITERRRIEPDDKDFERLSDAWSKALNSAFHDLPHIF
ncbi:proteasome-type protease [Hoeflea prorocentri]|uniref:Proteasome-type protease n=1 Tax=Hoeflea prorocentri TaxID=1922333 RepID=A0A9X3ULD9_9HYPH|nr:proteasome-type protease [Hoeflea prorocentri]MCY6381126.1 proteasome-type protease [Hoeflea prorocentri]MDA5398926.1 proteasome-type protease [Hoeflea prorocentri]